MKFNELLNTMQSDKAEAKQTSDQKRERGVDLALNSLWGNLKPYTDARGGVR